MEIAKVGDVIEWTFPNTDMFIGGVFEQYMGRTFQNEVAAVFDCEDGIEYGIYTIYGQDIVSANECIIIKRI